MQNDREQILNFCQALWHPGDVREIRTFPSAFQKYPQKKSGYFDSPEALANTIAKLTPEEYEAIYITLNPVSAALLARAANKLKAKPRETTSDKDIISATYLLIDVDPVRPAGISATDAEKKHAETVLRAVIKDLGQPLLIQDSGNGYHAIYRTSSTDPAQKSAYLQALSAKYSNDTAKIDIAVFNPSRIVKLAGTWSCKGDSITERPHRMAKILKINSESKTLDLPELPTPPSIQSSKSPARVLDQITPTQRSNIAKVKALLEKNNITIMGECRHNDAIMLKLDNCVFNPDHSNNDSAVLIGDKGQIGYQCFHDSCQGKRWQDVVALYDNTADSQVDLGSIEDEKPKKKTQGQRFPAIEDWEELCAQMQWNFATDELTKDILCNGKRLTDGEYAHKRMVARDWLTAHHLKRDMAAFEDAVAMFAERKQMNEIKDYLESLKWDGVDRITELASYFHASHQDNFARQLEVWMATAVRRIYHSVGGMVLVFQGKQGVGKSYFSKWLCPLRPEKYFVESEIRPDDKDCRIRTASAWIWEVQELDKTTRKQDIAGVKAFITQTNFRERKPFGRIDEEFRPISAYIGTVNSDTFLVDQTGNRRFLVAEIFDINWEYTTIDKNQLWAQAVEAYRQGKYEMTAEETVARDERNKSFTSKYQFELYLDDLLVEQPGNFVTITEIIDFLADRKITFARNNEIWAYLKARGFQKVRRQMGNTRVMSIANAKLYAPTRTANYC